MSVMCASSSRMRWCSGAVCECTSRSLRMRRSSTLLFSAAICISWRSLWLCSTSLSPCSSCEMNRLWCYPEVCSSVPHNTRVSTDSGSAQPIQDRFGKTKSMVISIKVKMMSPFLKTDRKTESTRSPGCNKRAGLRGRRELVNDNKSNSPTPSRAIYKLINNWTYNYFF